MIAPLALLYRAGSSDGSSVLDITGSSSTTLASDVSDESGCCGPQGLVCSGPNFSGVVEETLYFAHPRSTGGSFDWGNHDMADSLGEAVRCRAQTAARSRSSSIVSRIHLPRDSKLGCLTDLRITGVSVR